MDVLEQCALSDSGHHMLSQMHEVAAIAEVCLSNVYGQQWELHAEPCAQISGATAGQAARTRQRLWR